MLRRATLCVLVLTAFIFHGTASGFIRIKPIENQEVDEGRWLRFEIEAASSSPVDWDADNMPDGARLENLREVLPAVFVCDFEWKPSFDQAGDYEIVIIAINEQDKENVADFIVDVADVNRPPSIPLHPHPSDGEEIFYEDYLELTWDEERRDADGDEVVFLVKVWKQGEPHNILYEEIVDELFYRITDTLEADTYFWRITAIDEHGLEKKGPNWKFKAMQWFTFHADSSELVVLIRKPGEYTGMWTDINVESNGDLEIYFEAIDAVGPNDEEIEIVYGTKEGTDDIVWHNKDWTMEIDFPENGYTFSLFFKIKAEPFHSPGLYQGSINLIVSMKN